MIPKFTAKFFAIHSLAKKAPLFVRVVRDWEENCKMVGQSKVNYQDLEVYWSDSHQFPCDEKHDGHSDSNPMPVITVTPFGDKLFKSHKVYFGLFSKSGIHIKLGATFGLDLTQTLTSTKLDQKEVDLKKFAEGNERKLGDDATVIRNILTPGMKQVDFKKTFEATRDLMYEERKLYTKFCKVVEVVKVKKEEERNLQRRNKEEAAYEMHKRQNFIHHIARCNNMNVSEYYDWRASVNRKDYELEKRKLT